MVGSLVLGRTGYGENGHVKGIEGSVSSALWNQEASGGETGREVEGRPMAKSRFSVWCLQPHGESTLFSTHALNCCAWCLRHGRDGNSSHPHPSTETGIWKLLMCLERPRTVSCRVPVLTSPAVREHTTCFLKGSLPFPVLQSWPRPPGVAAMNLKDLKRLRLLLDFISRGPDASGPHLEPQRLCGLLRPLSCSIYVFNLCVLCS